MILRGARLVTLDPASVETAELRIADGRIVERKARLDAADGEEVVDLSGRLLFPGFVNGHTHLYSALARGMPPPAETPRNFVEILERVWWRLDRALTLEGVEASALAGAADAALSGTTLLVDHHASPEAIEGSLHALQRGTEAVGVRSVLCYEVTDRNGTDGRDRGLRENLGFQKRHQSDLTRAMVGAHASFTLSDESLTLLADALRLTGGSLHVHVAEDLADVEDCRARYGTDLPHRFLRHGLLVARTLFAHCVHLSGEQLRFVGSQGAWVAHNPRSNMNNHVGYADTASLQRAVLGTDGMDQDMLAEARAAFLKMRDAGQADAFARTLQLVASGHRLAASLFGLPFGKLDAGAPADLVVFDYDPPTPLTPGNVGGHLLFGLDRSHVEHVLVAGRFVVRDRRLATVDGAALRERTRKAAAELWERLRTLP